MDEKPRICIVSNPGPLAAVVPLSNAVDVIMKLSSFTYLITGNECESIIKAHPAIKGYSISYKPKSFVLSKILAYIGLQIEIAYAIMRINRKIDVFVFFLGESLTLPVLVCKAMKKLTVLSLPGSVTKISLKTRSRFSKVAAFLETINYNSADKITIYSANLINEWGLEKYQNKICIAHEHYLDFDKFNISIQFKKREGLVGYIGRLSEEKGAVNFVNAITNLLKVRTDINFLIGGDGKLYTYIENYLDKHNLYDSVRLLGWISYDNLACYLNEIKLLVLPSYTEGLPHIMLEAMACGTPVLATPVGAIPDFIKDSETGFIMTNNSPECITKNVIRALDHPNLEQIGRNGRDLIKREFTLDKAVQSYREALKMM